MDPLSLTLAVVGFTTAVKETVELAHKIHGSFARASANLLKAQAAANDIKDTLNDLNDFCSRHHDILENASDLRLSLQDLLAKMKAFEVNIIPLIPQTGNSRKSRLILGWGAWKNSNKIEESIIELRSNVEKTIASFMMGALLRVEAKLEKMHQTTDRKLQLVHQELLYLRTMRTAPGSTSSSLLIGIPNATADMGEELASSTYIAFQIADISLLLEKLPLNHIAKTNPESFSPPPVVVRLYSPLLFVGIRRLSRRIISWVSQVRCILEMKTTSDSIYKASLILNHLAIGLSLLRMQHEAASMSRFSVKLCRILSFVDCIASAPHLAHRLCNLSVHAVDAGDHLGSLEAIEEAWTISTGIQNNDQSLENRILHCRILSQYATLVSTLQSNHERSVELSSESVHLLEKTIGISGDQHSRFASVNNSAQSDNQTVMVKGLDGAQSELVLGTYARALRQLSNSLASDGHLEESLLAKQRALAVFHSLKAIHDNGICLDLDLAETLYEIITHDIKLLLSREALLSFAEECIRIYRRHAEQKPSDFSRRLRHALFEKAAVLDSMGRHEYSEDTWREIALISQQLFRDDASYAYASAKIRSLYSPRGNQRDTIPRTASSLIILSAPSPSGNTTGIEAERFYDLCLDLQRAQRYSEAMITARKAVDRYRLLASENPLLWMRHVGKGMTELAHSYWFSGNQNGAYDLGHESLHIFQTYSKSLPSILSGYCYTLQINLKVAHIMEDATKATTRYLDVMQHTRELAIQHPGNWDVGLIALRAQVCYGSTLVRLNRTRDAHVYFHELISGWQNQTPCTAPSNFVDWKCIALSRYGYLLDTQGLTELALETIQNAQDCANLLLIDIEIFQHFHFSSQLKVYFLVNLGRYNEALSLAEEVLSVSKISWSTEIGAQVLLLNAVALVADRLRLYDRVVEVAEEAVQLCQSDGELSNFQGPLRNGSTSLASAMHRALQFLSLGHASLGRINQALEYARQALENAAQLKSPWLPEFFSHQSYMESRAHLANILLMAGQADNAREIYEEGRDYLTKEVESRDGYYRDLIPTLRILGVIYCSEGRHAEGSAAAQESRLMLDRLDSVFHSLYKQVMARLQYEVQAPILQVVNNMRRGLQCDHQAEFAFAEDISRESAGI